MYGFAVLRAYENVGVFCFQAEDGIRDLVRSRGLGDVYKRQLVPAPAAFRSRCHSQDRGDETREGRVPVQGWRRPVSYTHLTLPTSDLV